MTEIQGRSSACLMEHEWQFPPALPAPLEKGALACTAGCTRDNQKSAPFCWAQATFYWTAKVSSRKKGPRLLRLSRDTSGEMLLRRLLSHPASSRGMGCVREALPQPAGKQPHLVSCRQRFRLKAAHLSPVLAEGQTHFISVLEVL